MKTSTTFSLPLQWICNQRSNVLIKSRWSLIGLLLLLMLPIQQTKAGYFYEYPEYFKITGTTCNGWLDIKIIGLNKDGNNDRMEDCTLKYSDDNGVTYKELLYFNVTNQDLVGNFTNKTTGLNYVRGTIVAPNPLFTNIGLQAYFKVKWYYPTSLVGKNLKFRIEGKWFRNYAASSGLVHDTFTGDYSVGGDPKNFRFFDTPSYNPTPTYTLTPKTDGTFNFAWSGASAFVSKFEFYTDQACTKLAGEVTGSTDTGSGSVKLGGFNVINTYYVKQIYTTSIPEAGFSTTYEKKITNPITHIGYQYPTDVATASKLNESQIELNWSIGNNASTLPSKFYIKRDGVLITPNGLTTPNYTDVNRSAWSSYKYTVYTVPDAWLDKSIALSELSREKIVTTIPPAIAFSGYKFTGYKGTSPYIKILWDNNEWFPVNNVKLYKKNDVTKAWVDLGVVGADGYYNDINGIVENKYFSYKIVVDQWNTKFERIDSGIVIDKVIISKIAVTKNTYGDRINLQWTIDRLNLCDRFEIYRSFALTGVNGLETWSKEVLVNQFTAQTLINSWDDRDASPGTLYKYRVVALKKTASLPEIMVDATDIGFRMPVGVVTGRITYGSGTAVKDASLYISSSSEGGDLLYKSLKFNGDPTQGGKVNLSKTKHGCIAETGFTFQSWIKPLSRKAVSATIFEVEKEYSIRMNSDNILVLLGSTLQQVRTYKLESSIAENTYFQLSVAYGTDKKLKLFINGQLKDSVILSATQTCVFNELTKCTLANNTSGTLLPFNGNVDDVRLWNRALGNKEIAENYNRYLGGSESGLIGYWPMDEGINSNAFDCSKTDKVFNESHITEIKKATSESNVPSRVQLSIKAVTDINGNYIIRGIPFSGEGSTYSITPVLGTHKFEPQQHLRYISPSSLVHNSSDFSDKSSFPVTVTVKYENTEYPVEGVSFSIDDYAVAKENKLVVTNEKGTATIDVPIGEHYIKASLVGHVFKDNGRYPGGVGKVIVDENFSSISFTDSSTVSVTGRVAGGLLENSKVVGFGKGKANIGQATIILKPAQYSNYSLNNTGSTRTLEIDKEKKIKSTSTILNAGLDVVIKTDPITGEYFVKLPPIGEWTVSSVLFQSKGVTQTMDQGLYNKSIKVNPSISTFDTLRVAVNKIDTFRYNVKQNFIHRVTPTIDVKDPFSYPAYGDSKNIIVNANNPALRDTVALYSVTNNIVDYTFGKTVSYPKGKPVFTMGSIYTLSIYGYEEYFDNASVSTKVPTDGATITVTNEMGKIVKNTAPGALDTVPVHVMKLDSLGRINYQFLAGFPKFTTPEDGLGLSVNLEYDKVNTPWSQNTTFRGIVLGYEPVGGANFVTKGPGPIMPLVVLRDPPGTNSYAYLEKGTEISYSFSTKTNTNGSFSNKNCMTFGLDILTGGGLGFITLYPNISDNKIAVGVEGEYAKFTGKSTTKTLTLTERVQTSSSPDFVGSNADVYIGTSTNVYSTDCNYLELVKDGTTYQLTSNVKPTTNTEGATDFRYSQNEILTAQIPLWQKRIKDILKKVTPSEYSNPIPYLTENRYITLMDPNDEKFGMDESTYKVVKPTSNKVLVNQVDSMATYIRNWRNLIARNEESKIYAKTDVQGLVYEKTNISFDAGAVVERSYSYSISDVDSKGNSKNTQAVIGGSYGYKIAGNGVVSEVEGKVGGGKESESSDGKASTTTFGFVLSDDDTDNRFSLNVYSNKFLSSDAKALKSDANTGFVDSSIGSYIFELAAGNTSCPYEASDSTLFYKGKTSSGAYKTADNDPLLPLASGSQALDVPVIDILPINVKTDVPNGKEATFSLKLESGSMGFNPRPYVLSVDESTNKDGAIISVDGVPLTDNRTYYISKGQPLFKTLTLKQTKTDILNYPNIKLQLSSDCGDISTSKNISVGFVPSCSDLELVIDSLTMNTITGNSVLLKLKNFSQEYTNFMGIKIQYKLKSDKDWREKLLAKKGVGFGVVVPDSIIPELKSSMDYRLNFKGLEDGVYEVRAMTLCKDPNSSTPINNITPELTVVKDMIRPTSMGAPSPSNGILTPDEEIAVTFNESLLTNRMVEPDFEVVGVLNGATLQHNEGLALDGNATNQAFTESSVSLQNSSFAIEGWVQTADGGALGNVFSIGEGADKLTLKMNKTSVALYVNDTQVGTTESITPKSDWQYVSLNYDAYTKKTKLFVLNSVENQEKLIIPLSNGINPAGRLIVGSGFSGKIHQIAVWNMNRNLKDLSDMNTAKTGTENSLVGYWPMDEANGKMAADKVRSRNMIVNSAWFVEPNGKSGVFNGIDKSVTINTSNIPLTATDNFSLEFWFSGNAQKNSTIFSCGKGIGDAKVDQKLSVGFDDAGALNLFSKDVSYVIPNVIVLDGNWHHFAMSVSRSGNTNLFVDGQQRLQIPSAKISGLASSKMTIGSRSYYLNDNVSFVKDQYFNGKIDEVRIWKTALTSEIIRLDMRSKLDTTAIGLIAYYPFEKGINANGKLVEASLEDASIKHATAGIATNMVYSDITPGIKMSRQKVKVNFNYTASDNKIVFTINDPLKKIENCILEFAIKKVLDKNGNELTEPIRWTAYVNNNRLKWESEQVVMTKQVLAPASFKATIVNKSGKYENFVVDGLPNWLSVNKSSGRLNPLEKTELTFTVDNSINVGSYESRVTLTGNNGIQEMFPVSLKVTGPRPDWTVNPNDFESSMNITGQVKIDNVYQEDTEDILAAFIGTKCVGIVNPQFSKTLNSYVLFMDVYGNTEDAAKALTFSLWDAGTGRIYPGVDVVGGALTFSSGSIIGSVAAPKVFNAIDKVEQQLNIKKGWNWISTNVVNSAPTLFDQVKLGLETDGITLKSKTAFSNYSVAGLSWSGSLTSLNQRSMYLLCSGKPKTVKVIGSTAKSVDYPITIGTGWNWIGYVPQFVAPIQEALSSLNAVDGDQIKGQVGFATYSGGNWNGSLQYLVPGQGYMFNSNVVATRTLTYPSQYISRLNVKRKTRNDQVMHWTYNENAYPQNMLVTAIVKIDDVESANENLQVAAFIDNTCRGTINLILDPSTNRYYAYVTVQGDGVTDVNKKITFKCFNPAANKEFDAVDKSIGYISDSSIGSAESPYVMLFNNISSNPSDLFVNTYSIYPNPVISTLNFSYNPQGIERLEVVDCTGRTMVISTTVNKNSIDVSDLMPGIYTLRVNYKGAINSHRFIKK